tara:strand:- start:10938 stop:11678 length:741 start_codon:yes stop_codon:yes gene_type:complete
MFQISATISHAIAHKIRPVFNFKSAQQVHENIDSYGNNIFRKITNAKFRIDGVYKEPHYHYNAIPLNRGNIILDGYFQSEKYFHPHSKVIRMIFSEDTETKNYIDDKYLKLLDSDTCSVHIRRKDYLNLQEFHPIQTINYYNKAMAMIGKKRFIIFSDDIPWCKDNLQAKDIYFMEGEKDYVDLFLMSRCNNHIIANSSFSWWAAWLNKSNQKRVIAPENWFGPNLSINNTKDLIPESWEIIDDKD